MNTPQYSDNRKYRPRVTLLIPPRDGSIHQNPSPFVLPPNTAATSITSQLPQEVNPFVQALYAQRASEFMSKHFEGLNRFTKSGLSVGEKSAVWLHTKFRTWTNKWFTHIFLFIIMTVYSVCGALIFQTVEGRYIPKVSLLLDMLCSWQ
jgi:hypothetical protein